MALDVGPSSLSGQVGKQKLAPRAGGGMGGGNPMQVGDMTAMQGGKNPMTGGPSFSMDPGAMQQFKQKVPGGGFSGGSGIGANMGAAKPQVMPQVMNYGSQMGGQSNPMPQGGGMMRPGGAFGSAFKQRDDLRQRMGGNRGSGAGLMGGIMGRGPMQGGGINTAPSNAPNPNNTMMPGNMVSGTPQAYSMMGGVPVPYGNNLDFYKSLMSRGMDIMDPNTFSQENIRGLGY